MYRARRFFFVALALLAPTLSLQAQTTTGSILGDVIDPSGAVLDGAAIRAVNDSTGAVRRTRTNAQGLFRIDGLVPALYSVTVEFPGFRSVTHSGLRVPIQGEVKLDFELTIGPVAESVSVTSQAPLVATTEQVIKTVVDNRLVENLPLKSRDFLDLGLLAPGVSLDQSSIRSGATESISFFGLEERYKSVWLEGVDFNDEVTSGGTNLSRATRTRLGQEAVQEFQVLTSGYSAEFGRSAAGAINVVIKSGGNNVHGNAFYFLRDDSFDKPAFRIVGGEATPASEVPPFKRQQYGGTVGGPIVRDRAFYFGSIERQTGDESAQISIPKTVEEFVDSLGLGYDTRSVVPQERRAINALGKFTFNLNPSHTLNATYLYDDNREFNKNIGGQIGADNGFDDLGSSYFASLNHSSILGTATVNELRVNRSIQRLFRGVQSGGPFLPTLDFPSVDVGTNGGTTPQGRVQKNWILANTTSYQTSNHTIKWGGEINNAAASNDTNGTFNGAFRFPDDTAPFVPNRYVASFNLQFERGDSPDPTFVRVDRDVAMYALFVTDTWRVNRTLTLNAGLRYDLRVFKADLGGPDAFEQSGFSRGRPQDVWLEVALGPAGALGTDYWRPVPTDSLDLSPRFGLSWDPRGDGRAVIRASYGIFHDRIWTLGLRGVIAGYNGLIAQRVEVTNPDFFPNIPAAAGLPATTTSVTAVPAPSADTPYAQHASAGFGFEVSPDVAFSADFTHILGLNFQIIYNANAPLPLETTGGERVCPMAELLVARGAGACTQMRMSQDQSNRLHVNTATLRLERRFADRYGFLIGYTVGQSKQWSEGAFGSSPSNAYDRFNELDFGPTANDVRHRFTGHLMYELPFEVQFATIVTANSAPPFNHTTGLDDNLDFVRNDRPAGVGFNSLRGEPFFQADVRLSKRITIDDNRDVEVLWEMFNLFNRANLSNFNGNARSSTFRQARTALSPFQAQFGIKFRF